MAQYIENDCNCPDCNHNEKPSVISKYTENNNKRWEELLKDWDTLSDTDKAKFFIPMVKFINTRDMSNDPSELISFAIAEISIKSCRTVKEIIPMKDYNGNPNISVVFNPIIVQDIPSDEIREKVFKFGTIYGYI